MKSTFILATLIVSFLSYGITGLQTTKGLTTTLEQGIEKTKIDSINIDYINNCLRGQEKCIPLNLQRDFTEKKWNLFIPFNCNYTSITLYNVEGTVKNNKASGNNIEKSIEQEHYENIENIDSTATVNIINLIKDYKINSGSCSALIDLSNLSDGKYYLNMKGYELGGLIKINLITLKN